MSADPARPDATLDTTASALSVSAFGRNVRTSAPMPLRKIGPARASAPKPVGESSRPRMVAGTARLQIHEPTSSAPAIPARVSMVGNVSSCRSRSWTSRWLRSSRSLRSALSEWIWIRLSTDSSSSSSFTASGS